MCVFDVLDFSHCMSDVVVGCLGEDEDSAEIDVMEQDPGGKVRPL